jgi:two-component system phosphate regulon sensor histidine kinase PhoR
MRISPVWIIAIAAATVAATAGVIAPAQGVDPALAAVLAVVLGLGGAALSAALSRPVVPVSAAEQPGRSADGTAARANSQGLLADLPLPLVLLDHDRKLHFANGAAVELFGSVRQGEVLSSIIRSPLLAEAVAAVSSGGAPTGVEFTHMRAREQRVLLAHVAPVDSPAGRLEAAIMIVIEDHTRLARIEQMRSDFIANASHELRTPLAAIIGFIETLRGTAADDSEARARFLPIMAREAERMTRLVEDLMSLNRIEMNAHLRPSDAVALGGLLHETAAAVAPLARAAEMRIEIGVPRAGTEVIGDHDELHQLFVNLIDNAIKYGGSGGLVEIELAPNEPGRARMVGVAVTDHGPGIARQHIPRLTERFYRVPGGRGGAKAGTGLGLSIVKHILNRHRGDLTIRSEPGQGATFTVWLPSAASGVGSGTAK